MSSPLHLIISKRWRNFKLVVKERPPISECYGFVHRAQGLLMTNLELVKRPEGGGVRRKLLQIVSSAGQRGDGRLPTERELTRQLSVKRGVVRRFLAELEAEDKIWRHVGRGTFAGRRPVEADPDLKLVCDHSSP